VNSDWIGLIPAAGKGLRLKLPYPKELYPIIRNNKYKPVSQFIVDQMIDAGVHHIVFVINETKHQLIGYFGDGSRFGSHFSYVVQEQSNKESQSTSPGLAHALDAAFHLTQGKLVFFGMADTIIQPNNVFSQGLGGIGRFDVMLYLIDTRTPQKFGMVEATPHGEVLQIIDKPEKTELTRMWACILWKPIFTEFLHEQVACNHVSDFAQIMNEAIHNGLNFGSVHVKDGNYIDLGTYDEIMELDKHFREERD
jgi:dTDP-glucose pyrophosphorylase